MKKQNGKERHRVIDEQIAMGIGRENGENVWKRNVQTKLLESQEVKKKRYEIKIKIKS